MRLPFSRAASGGNFLGPACEPQDIRRDQVDDGAVDGRFLRVFELSDEAVDGPAEDDVPPLSLAVAEISTREGKTPLWPEEGWPPFSD